MKNPFLISRILAGFLLGGLLINAGRATEPAAASAAPAANAVENSVVKVFSTVRYPDYYRPWTKQAPAEVTGSGVVIEGHRILTNAHVVAFASQVQVQANQAGDKISATVVAFAPGIDLALLKLDDETFFDTHQPLVRAPVQTEFRAAECTRPGTIHRGRVARQHRAERESEG